MDSNKKIFVGTFVLSNPEDLRIAAAVPVLIIADDRDSAYQVLLDHAKQQADELEEEGRSISETVHCSVRDLHIPAAILTHADVLYSNLVSTRAALNGLVSNKNYEPLAKATSLLTRINEYDVHNPENRVLSL